MLYLQRVYSCSLHDDTMSAGCTATAAWAVHGGTHTGRTTAERDGVSNVHSSCGVGPMARVHPFWWVIWGKGIHTGLWLA